MLIYVFDGTFEGLLTAVYEAYYRKENPQEIVYRQNLQESFLDCYVCIDTDENKAQKVYTSIQSKISKEALENVYYVFLSGLPGSGTWIYEYLKLGWKTGINIDLYLSDDRVLRIVNLKRKVGFEVQRMLGLVRFKCMEGGIFYAPIRTDYNILELLAPHFAARLADQPWVIHDTGRGTAAIYDRMDWVIAKVDNIPNLGESKMEACYQELWKRFYKSIAIKNRVNPRLQRQLMPVRYWNHLTEMQ